jgi:hypothetical protein
MPSKKARANRPAGKASRSPKREALFNGQLTGAFIKEIAQHRDWTREAKAQTVPA